MKKEEGTTTIPESQYRRLLRKADEATQGPEYQRRRAAHESGAKKIKEGQFGAGILEVGGDYAPLVTAGAVSALIFYIAESKTFREMEFVKQHWWVRGFAGLLLAFVLWKRGYETWAMGLVGVAMGILISDYNNRDQGKPAGDPNDAGDEAGYWVGDRWYPQRAWDEPRRLERAWNERLAGIRRAEELADRVYEPAT